MKTIKSYDQLEDMDSESKYLVHKAKEAATEAYAAYSKFHVGAALILEDGTLITGSNQENAAYPLSMCAERVALYATAAAYSGKVIAKIAVAAHRKNQKELQEASPCGSCRQVLLEFEQRQKMAIQVVFLGTNGKWLIIPSAAQLLPYHFDRKSLS